MNETILYYVHDPMCSWCWAFRNTWAEVKASLGADVVIENLVGGLAPDSDEPMPMELQKAIPGYWREIEKRVPGTQFNYDFWTTCSPRRSTYPACRAVIAAAEQNVEEEMILGIQQAYYLKAKNPSNIDTLIDVAGSIGLDEEAFAKSIASEAMENELKRQLAFAQGIGGVGFPSLFLKKGNVIHPISVNYTQSDPIMRAVRSILS